MTDLNSILGILANSPNWQYQLGLGEQQQQGMGTAANYLLGQGQNQNQAASISNQFKLGTTGQKNQLDEFLQQLGLQRQNQEFEQGNTRYLESPAYATSMGVARSAPALMDEGYDSYLKGKNLQQLGELQGNRGYVPADETSQYYDLLGQLGYLPNSAATATARR